MNPFARILVGGMIGLGLLRWLLWQGWQSAWYDAQSYDTHFLLLLDMGITLGGLALMLWLEARIWGQMQRDRQQTEVSLSQINATLELNVAERTAELEHSQSALRQSEAELRALFAGMQDIVLVRDDQGRCLKIAPTQANNLYQSRSAMLGKTLHETFPPEPADRLLRCIQRALTLQQPVQTEYRLQIGPRQVDFAASLTPLSPDTVLIVAHDISDRKQMEEALFREKELAQVTLHSIGDGVIRTDAQGRITYCNPVAIALTGWSQDEATGVPLTTVFPVIHETTREPLENPVARALRGNRVASLTTPTVLMARHGSEVAIEHSANPICDRWGQVIGAVLVFRDVTLTRNLSRQLSWRASHDALTGLVNRPEFEQRLAHALAHAQSHDAFHTLCYLDLDRFKQVNDTCGHAAGDELLRQVTGLMQTHIRKADILARLGGDEFAILLHHCPIAQAFQIANQLREQLQAFQFVWRDQPLTVGVSIGLVGITASTESVAIALSAADAACYRAKHGGRNQVHIHEADALEIARLYGETSWGETSWSTRRPEPESAMPRPEELS